MQMTCPKCQGQMRQYERNSVTIDQCSDCRGIFLDRGELERLIDAESRWNGAASPAPAAPGYQAAPPAAYPQQQHGQQHYGHGYGGQHGHKKRKSFLEELFD